jgi:hypothetical protein
MFTYKEWINFSKFLKNKILRLKLQTIVSCNIDKNKMINKSVHDQADAWCKNLLLHFLEE